MLHCGHATVVVYVMVIVTVLLFTELKHTFTELAQRMKNDEMITLAKFLAISGIILPMLPNENLIPGINLTPYSIWLATVLYRAFPTFLIC